MNIADLRVVLADRTSLSEYPHAAAVEQEVLVYDLDGLRAAPPGELVRAFAEGPGVIVVRGAFPDTGVVDRATAVFEQLIATGTPRGDHFAPPGANDRIWNALEKLAITAPEVFVDYYAHDVVALVSLAWLGPAYQVTSQVNVVNPGGRAQVGHRDYHLGFLAPDVIEQYPEHVHRLSPVLTLQGAVAHTDMPLESGPTLYLPHSQKYGPGYLATSRPEFREYFEEHHVQLPLRKGDAAFFNPAVIHGAGNNDSTDIRRMANLLQISSAFGRAMESVDRTRICAAVYQALHTHTHPEHAIAAAAEGYAFPTSLDRDPPVDGLSPPSQADVVRQALTEAWPQERVEDALAEHAARRGNSSDERHSRRIGSDESAARRDGEGRERALDGRVLLVSGGTQGVGAGVAAAAVREGATVAITGRRPELGAKVAADIGAFFVRADVADVEQAQASVAAVVTEFGRIDALVNSAGLTDRGTLLDTSPELFDRHIAINLRGPFFLMQAAVRDMLARKSPGAIVNIISSSELGGQPYLAPYVAAKAGLAGVTRNAAHAHRFDRIRINGLDIGWTDTEGEDATQKNFHAADDTWLAQAATKVPMGKIGQVDEIADFVVFLLSDRSGVVTGSVIDWDQNVFGGLD